ncbi:MAG: hypothetical protein Q9220_006772 [cf. Caloplaca sp. 1 TL-2023]
MILVDYSDSEDSDGHDNVTRSAQDSPAKTNEITRKRKREEQNPGLPPLPDSFHDLYASTARKSKHDDPSLHDGRQRQIPHVEGQWPTHVYIEWWPSGAESETLNNILARVEKALPPDLCLYSSLKSDLGSDLPLHISLSRTLTLNTDQRQSFSEALKRALDASGVKPFTVTMNGLRWVTNHEKNRWFLVVQAQRPSEDELNRLLRASNLVARNFGQPLLYASQAASNEPIPTPKKHASDERGRGAKANASKGFIGGTASTLHSYEDMSDSFHISIAWTLEEPPRNLQEYHSQGNAAVYSAKSEVLVQAVKAKMGNGTMVIPIGFEATMSNEIIGL